MNPTLVITSFFLILILKAIIDQHIILDRKESPDHPFELLIVVIVTMAHGAFIARVHTPENWVPDDYTMAVLLFYPTAWWAFFDGVLNKLLKRDWFAIGNTSKTDRLFQRLGKPTYIITKGVAFALMIASIVIIYKDSTWN